MAGTGREAVELAAAGDYDLIPMDVQMPELDGLKQPGRYAAPNATRTYPSWP